MIFSRNERFGLSFLMILMLCYTIIICIHQQRCLNNYLLKNIWINRNKERQAHGASYRLDAEQGIIVKSERSKLFLFSEGLANVSLGERWGFIDRNGEWAIRPRYTGAWPFSHGLAGIMQNDKFGFIDKTGRMVIRAQFDNIRDFCGAGLAAVRLNRLWGFIDTTGSFIVQPSFEWADSFNEGLALVKQKGLYGYINTKGRVVIKPRYRDGLRFQEGLAGVCVDGKYGFINLQGKVVIQPGYNQVMGFSEGMAAVEVNGTLGYINRHGKMVIQGSFTSLGNFHYGVAVGLKNGRECLLDQTGGMIPTGFRLMQDYSEGYAAVGIDVKIEEKKVVKEKLKTEVKIIQKYNFCTSRLEMTGQTWYREVWPYSQGLAAVQMGRQIGFIRNGREAIQPKFDWVDPDRY